MAPRLKITRTLIDKLEAIKLKIEACLYGIMYDGNLLVVGFKAHKNEENPTIPYSFVTEVDLCGVVVFGADISTNSNGVTDVLKQVDITDNPLVISCPSNDSTQFSAYFCVHDRLEKINYEIVSESDIWKDFVHIRLKTRLNLICDWNLLSLKDACAVLHKKFVSGQVSFHFPKSGVYLIGNDSEAGLSGITGDPVTGELCNFSSERIEGLSNMRLKKKTEQIEILDVEMFWKPTHEAILDETVKHAPIINHNKKSFDCLTMHLKIDALSLLYRKTKVINTYNILIESLCRSLKLNEQCLITQLNQQNNGDTKLIAHLPIPYHFIPRECGHFVTCIYTNNFNDNQLEKERKLLHNVFLLPLNRPYFRRSNAFMFNDNFPHSDKLVNPHEGIKSQVKNGEVSLVQGKYTYFHYMQDDFNDDGWGCAYRSLQTLCSWFWWQGYTTLPIPSHKEIQECLVRIGDKPASFINSRQWIGSTEVSFCLETMLGVTSRIIACSSGSEMASLGPQLTTHFKKHGTPIMVGGGVLAHTIIGVDYNKDNDDLKFLILDPHFKGNDDINQVQTKGGCGWKGVEFWKKGDYYNLCLPQLPNFI